jgi:hypothetical protein
MFAYNVAVTNISFGVIATIVALSLLVTPAFRSCLNEQFLLGARD